MANSVRIDVGATDHTGQAITDIKRNFDGLGSGIGASLKNGLRDAGSEMKGAAKLLFGEVGDILKDQFKFKVAGALEGLGLDSESANSIARNASQFAGIFAGHIGTALAPAMKEIGSQAAEMIAGPMKSIAGKLTSAVANSGIVAALGPIMAGVGTAVGTIMTAAMAAAPLLLPALLIAAIVAAIVLVINDPTIPGKALDIGVGIVRGLLEGMVDLAKKLIGFIAGVIGGLWEMGVSIVKAVFDFGARIVGGIIGGLVGLGAELIKTITDTIAKLPEFAISIIAKLDLATLGLQIQELLGFLPPGFTDAVKRAQGTGGRSSGGSWGTPKGTQTLVTNVYLDGRRIEQHTTQLQWEQSITHGPGGVSTGSMR